MPLVPPQSAYLQGIQINVRYVSVSLIAVVFRILPPSLRSCTLYHHLVVVANVNMPSLECLEAIRTARSIKVGPIYSQMCRCLNSVFSALPSSGFSCCTRRFQQALCTVRRSQQGSKFGQLDPENLLPCYNRSFYEFDKCFTSSLIYESTYFSKQWKQ